MLAIVNATSTEWSCDIDDKNDDPDANEESSDIAIKANGEICNGNWYERGYDVKW